MRKGWLELFIVSAEGRHPYNEEELPAGSGVKYAAVSPNDEYCVVVNLHRDPKTGKFPSRYLRVGLYIDGHDVNYWKRVDTTELPDSMPTISTVFWGYLKEGDDVRHFKIARVSQSSVKTNESEQNTIVGGKIVAIVHAAEIIEGEHKNIGKAIDVPTETNVSDQQKFYTLPSAVTVGGKRARNKEKFVPIIRWRNISQIPLASTTLHYHTRDMVATIRDLGVLPTDTSQKYNFYKTSQTIGPDIRDGIKERIDDCAGKNLEKNDGCSAISDKCEDEGAIEIVPVVKVIPMLDLTEDERSSAWSTRTVSRI